MLLSLIFNFQFDRFVTLAFAIVLLLCLILIFIFQSDQFFFFFFFLLSWSFCSCVSSWSSSLTALFLWLSCSFYSVFYLDLCFFGFRDFFTLVFHLNMKSHVPDYPQNVRSTQRGEALSLFINKKKIKAIWHPVLVHLLRTFHLDEFLHQQIKRRSNYLVQIQWQITYI